MSGRVGAQAQAHDPVHSVQRGRGGPARARGPTPRRMRPRPTAFRRCWCWTTAPARSPARRCKGRASSRDSGMHCWPRSRPRRRQRAQRLQDRDRPPELPALRRSGVQLRPARPGATTTLTTRRPTPTTRPSRRPETGRGRHGGDGLRAREPAGASCPADREREPEKMPTKPSAGPEHATEGHERRSGRRRSRSRPRCLSPAPPGRVTVQVVSNPPPRVVNGGHREPLRPEHPEQVLRDLGRRVLLEDPHAPIAGDVVLEALELDAPVARDVDDPERREVRAARCRGTRG